MSVFTCSICGKQVQFWDVAYIGNSLVICKNCYPDYYIKHCPLIKRRSSGESPPSCNYCLYKKRCDEYIKQASADKNK